MTSAGQMRTALSIYSNINLYQPSKKGGFSVSFALTIDYPIGRQDTETIHALTRAIT